MSYPSRVPVHTFTLSDAHTVTGSPVVVVWIASDGEVLLSEHPHYRDAQGFCDIVEDGGGRVLAVVEGESDETVGTSSVWVSR